MVAYDVENKKLLPFQSLAHRGRKNVNINEITIRVIFMAFDLLLFNDES